MQIGEKIKLLRTKKGLIQDALSRKLNGSSQAISNWERQKGYPDISNIIQLSDLFNVSLDDLIKEDFDFKEQLLNHKIENGLDVIMNSCFLIIGTIGILFQLVQFSKSIHFSSINPYVFFISLLFLIDGIVFFLKKKKKNVYSVS